MKRSKGEKILALCALTALAAALGTPLQAQTWNGGELPLVDPPPTNGTFFLVSRYGEAGFGRPFAANPFALFGAPVYDLGLNVFVVDDSGVDWADVHARIATNAALRPQLGG